MKMYQHILKTNSKQLFKKSCSWDNSKGIDNHLNKTRGCGVLQMWPPVLRVFFKLRQTGRNSVIHLFLKLLQKGIDLPWNVPGWKEHTTLGLLPILLCQELLPNEPTQRKPLNHGPNLRQVLAFKTKTSRPLRILFLTQDACRMAPLWLRDQEGIWPA